MGMDITAILTMAGADIMITDIGDGTTNIQPPYLFITTIIDQKNIAETLIYTGRVQEAPGYMAVQEITELDLEVA
jgi:hypothetical protein